MLETYYRDFWNAQEDYTYLQILGNTTVACSTYSTFFITINQSSFWPVVRPSARLSCRGSVRLAGGLSVWRLAIQGSVRGAVRTLEVGGPTGT